MADMSWLGNAIGGTMSGILGLIGTGITNTTNQNIANQNLGFQRENLDYQKALQREIFEREDSAYQRSVNDMRLAGMNPLAMQGTNGAGEAIATEPMHNDFQYQDMISGLFNTVNQFMSMRNNSTLANAQADLMSAQADSQKIENKYQEQLVLQKLNGMKFDNVAKRFSNERQNIAWQQELRDLAFNEQFGLSNNMPDFAKILNYSTHQGSLSSNWQDNYVHPDDPENFGKGRTYFKTSPQFTSLDSLLNDFANFKGAIMENKLGAILLQMLGIK